MLITKTKDYERFKFRHDNRECIDRNHVNKIANSIKAKNLLEFRPILVDAEMNIIDGQHRLLAAKQLGVDIYYQQNTELESNDILVMNINKNWTFGDYLNYYVKNQNDEYIKLRDFAMKHNVSLKVALNITMGESKNAYKDFKNGEYKFSTEDLEKEIDICWDTVNYIKKMNGYSPYTLSSRFWKALLRLVKHPDFCLKKWVHNREKMSSHFVAKVGTKEYVNLFESVYNWRNQNKISLDGEEI